MELPSLLKTLSDLPGVSNFEDEVRAYLRTVSEPFADDMKESPLGSLLVFKKGAKTPKRPIAVSAGMDEAGFLVTGVGKDGMLRIEAVDEKFPASALFGLRLKLAGTGLRGVVPAKAIQLTSRAERGKYPEADDLRMDVGRDTDAETEKLVRIGDPVVLDAPFHALCGGRVAGKAFENRIPCAQLLALIERKPAYDTWFVFSTRTFIGASGAVSAARILKPGVVIGAGSVQALDIPGIPPHRRGACVGGGAGATIRGGRIFSDRALTRDLLRSFAQKGKAANLFPENTDSSRLYGFGDGVADVKILSIDTPVRHLRTPFETAAAADIEMGVDLLETAIETAGAAFEKDGAAGGGFDGKELGTDG
ncbi:MAG: hypothetical protein LBO81_01480 [Clostridiales Family XIII bacterium]|jgi:endoglucanase|nr:hypothetical protein [Clostridiales Family XIII bacterium]